MLKPATTPLSDEDYKGEDLNLPGLLFAVARRFVGMLLFTTRGTRPDIFVAVIRLGRSVGAWKVAP